MSFRRVLLAGALALGICVTGGPADGGDAVVVPTFHSLVPARLLETRPGLTTIDGQAQGDGAVGAGHSIVLMVVGRGGVPATGVGSVALNVTVTEPTAATFITVYPDGATRPTASNLNATPGQTVPNMVIVPVGEGGQVDLYNNAGTAQLVVDVLGWFPDDAAAYTGLTPARLLDTRAGQPTSDGLFVGGGALGAASTTLLTVAGRGGVPADAAAVALNVTVTAPTGASFVTVFPAGLSLPTASNVNFVPGQTVPNMVIVRVGANGQVALFNNAGTAHLVVDVLGWFPVGASFTGLTPARLLETRAGLTTVDGQFLGGGAVGHDSSLAVQIAGRGGVPATGAGAVALNITVTNPTAAGFLTAFGTGQERPTASNLNFVPGATVANLALVSVGESGRITIYNSAGTSDVIIDVLGWFPIASTPSAPCPGSSAAPTQPAFVPPAGHDELADPPAGEWPTFKRDLAHTGSVTGMSGRISAGSICTRWTRAISAPGTRGASGPLVADIAGVPTVFFVVDCPPSGCSADTAGVAYALRGDTGDTIWSTTLPGGAQSDPYAPTLADIDGDGKRELIFASNNSNQVFALRTEAEGAHPAGSIQWTFTFAAGVRSEGAPVVANFDTRDPWPEVVIGSDFSNVPSATSSAVYLLDGATGQPKGVPFLAPSRQSMNSACVGGNKIDSSSPTVANVGGGLKVYVGAWNGTFYALQWQLSPAPGLYQAWANTLPPVAADCPIRKVRSGAVVAQMVPGGDPEVAFGYMVETDGFDQYKTARLRIANANGLATLQDVDVWDWKSSPSAADLDPASPGAEIVGGSYQGFYAVHRSPGGTFEPAWARTMGDGNGGFGGNRSSPAVADIDGDGHPDVIQGVEGGADAGMYAFDGATGEIVWQVPMPGTGGVDSSPAIGDIDGDGHLEVVYLGRDGVAYALDGS